MRNSVKMQPIKVKIMKIKASWAPQSLGALGKYPLFPSRWSCLGRTTLVVTPLGVVAWWSCIGAH